MTKFNDSDNSHEEEDENDETRINYAEQLRFFNAQDEQIDRLIKQYSTKHQRPLSQFARSFDDSYNCAVENNIPSETKPVVSSDNIPKAKLLNTSEHYLGGNFDPEVRRHSFNAAFNTSQSSDTSHYFSQAKEVCRKLSGELSYNRKGSVEYPQNSTKRDEKSRIDSTSCKYLVTPQRIYPQDSVKGTDHSGNRKISNSFKDNKRATPNQHARYGLSAATQWTEKSRSVCEDESHLYVNCDTIGTKFNKNFATSQLLDYEDRSRGGCYNSAALFDPNDTLISHNESYQHSRQHRHQQRYEQSPSFI